MIKNKIAKALASAALATALVVGGGTVPANASPGDHVHNNGPTRITLLLDGGQQVSAWIGTTWWNVSYIGVPPQHCVVPQGYPNSYIVCNNQRTNWYWHDALPGVVSYSVYDPRLQYA